MEPDDELEANPPGADAPGIDAPGIDAMDGLAETFCDQLMACLDECARGRKGLFSDVELLGEEAMSWQEAARLRELAMALQSVFAQQERQNALCDEFLDLCSMHGESHPGERKLARAFLERIERGEVGIQPKEERRFW
jgi:hypothetical protein